MHQMHNDEMRNSEAGIHQHGMGKAFITVPLSPPLTPLLLVLCQSSSTTMVVLLMLMCEY